MDGGEIHDHAWVPPAETLRQRGRWEIELPLRGYQQRRWRNAATTTLIARNTGTTGQWEGRITCAARDALMRAMPLSL